MARKLTARQRKARKQASYRKAEYNKNVDAIKYLERLGVTAPKKAFEIPEKVTKQKLKFIRKVYKEMRANIKKYNDDYVNIETGELLPVTSMPTKEQMVKYYRHPEQTPTTQLLDFDIQSIEEIKEHIAELTPREEQDKTSKNFNKNVVPKHNKFKQDFLDAIDNAINQYGADIVAQALAQNDYMQRVENLQEKYTFEIIESNADGLFDLMNISAMTALNSIE